MKLTLNSRGFEILRHPEYASSTDECCLVAQSSAINPLYDDILKRPGSSYLWIGALHHLDRSEVRELIKRLQRWLDTGYMRYEGEEPRNGD